MQHGGRGVIHVVESAEAVERIEAARAFLAALPAGGEALVVGASRDAADDVVRRATATSGATFGIHRASLVQLAVRVAAAELARIGAAPASALGTEALAARVTFEAFETAALGYFTPVARFPGFARALASTLGELRLAGVAADTLVSVGRAGTDVGQLLTRFEEALRVGGLADRAALFDVATAVMSRGTPAAIARLPVVLLDVPIVSAAERAFVGSLVTVSPSVLVTVPAGDDRTREALRELGARPSGPSAGAPGEGSALAHLRTYLFSERAPVSEAPSGEAVFFSAPGEGRECL